MNVSITFSLLCWKVELRIAFSFVHMVITLRMCLFGAHVVCAWQYVPTELDSLIRTYARKVEKTASNHTYHSLLARWSPSGTSDRIHIWIQTDVMSSATSYILIMWNCDVKPTCVDPHHSQSERGIGVTGRQHRLNLFGGRLRGRSVQNDSLKQAAWERPQNGEGSHLSLYYTTLW